MKNIKSLLIALAFVLVMPLSQAAVGGGQELITREQVESIIAEEVPKQMEMVLFNQGNTMVPIPPYKNNLDTHYAYHNNQVVQQAEYELLKAQNLSDIGTISSFTLFLLGLVCGSVIFAILGLLIPWLLSNKSDRKKSDVIDQYQYIIRYYKEDVERLNKVISEKDNKIQELNAKMISICNQTPRRSINSPLKHDNNENGKEMNY